MNTIYEPRGKYTIYMHISPSNKKYIGITKRNPKYRWNNGNAYQENNYFKNAIKKYGWNNFQHIILFTNLTKEKAELKEQELILKYKSTNENFGYNLESGGNIQKEINNITRKKMSNAATKRMSNIKLRKKISKTLTGRKISPEIVKKSSMKRKGIKLTEKHKAKLRGRKKTEAEIKKTNEAKFKKTSKYSLNGTFLKKYKSQKEAAKENNILATCISQCIHKRTKTAGGYKWE